MISENRDRILDFSEPIRVWQIGPAKRIANEIDEGGFASLFVVSSLFELFGSLESDTHESKRNFISGFVKVFPEFRDRQNDIEFREMIYSDFRGGMYHQAIPRSNVKIDKNILKPIEITENVIKINPAKFVDKIEEYFDNLVDLIKNEKNEKIQENFKRIIVFDPKVIAEPTYFFAYSGQQIKIDDSNRHEYSCCYPCYNQFKNIG